MPHDHPSLKTVGIALLLLLSSSFLLAANLLVSPAAAQAVDTPTGTATPAETSTDTPAPSDTPTATFTSVLSTETATSVPPTETATSAPTSTETLTATPAPTDMPSATSTDEVAPTNTPTATGTASPTSTPIATETPAAISLPAAAPPLLPLALPGDVVINEVVTDPQQDWSTSGFDGVAGAGPISDADEFVELYIKTAGLNLSGWTIELRDTSPVTGSLASGGAFQVSRYVGTGNFTNTLAGDYLVLGDVRGAGAMNNSLLLVLIDNSSLVIDKVELGNDLEGDGPGDGAPDGTTRGGNANNSSDEAVLRSPNGADSDNDIADFITGTVTLGSTNGAVATPTPSPTPLPPTPPPMPGSVVINEVAWGGTTASASDEWLELLNVTTQTITLTSWTITSTGGINIPLSGAITPNGYYLIERNEGVITDVASDLLASFSLVNSGAALTLSVGGIIIDTANGDGGPWPAGSGSPDYRSMERINALAIETDLNWAGNDLIHRNGLARDGVSPINGTPKQPNSTTYPPPPTPTPTPPPPLGSVIINEVAWSGTIAGSSDEWLELFNTTSLTVTLSGWVITGTSGLNISLAGEIGPGAYYLIERNNDGVITDTLAELTPSFGSGLPNAGAALFLSAGGVLIDSTNNNGPPWPAGEAAPNYASMERINPLLPDTDMNWAGNDLVHRNGLNRAGGPINGTPKQPNSTTYPPLPTPTPTPPPVLASMIINEVAWGGTLASASDEWIELYNTTALTIPLTGWVITNPGGLNISLTGAVSPNSYYLIERTDDTVIKDISATLTASFGSGLANGGSSLFLSAGGLVIDTANAGGGPWPAGVSSAVGRYSMERINPALPETDAAWASNKGCQINGLDAADNPIFGTPGQANAGTLPALPAAPLLISEFLYDGPEFVEICNPSLIAPVDLSCYKVGDEEIGGGNESMYRLPLATLLNPNSCLLVAKNATDFQARFSQASDYDLTDANPITDLLKYPVWANGSWSLANDGDEIVLLGPNNEILDSVAFRNGDYAGLGLEPDATAPDPHSLQRVWPIDTNSMPHDFVRTEPNPGLPTSPPPPPAFPAPAALPDGMYAYWGDLHTHTTYSDGSGPPYYALAMARAAGLHFQAITDHDWWLTPLEWAKILSQTTNATVPGQFIALRGIEWTHESVGHINVFNTGTLLNSRTDPMFNTLPDFYSWLAANPGVIAQFNHPDPSYGGTFYNFAYHAAAAQVMFMQEIGNKAQKYTTYEPSFVQSNTAGWRTAPTNNGDTHDAHWGSHTPARTGLVAPALTESDLLAAMRARRVFATEDSNLAVTLRVNGAWMGSSLTATGPLPLIVDVVDPDPEPLTLFLYDGNLLLASVTLATSTGQWSTTVNALPGHFLWVKVVQADGNTAYTAPVWIEGQAAPDLLVLNEILPAPHDWDWDGNGVADHQDEWIELYNPTSRPIGLGGWQLGDSSGATYSIPLGGTIPAHGFAVFYHASMLFSLNNSEETVNLIHPNGAVVDSFSYDHSPGYDESYCRLPDGGTTWSDNCGPSPNAANWKKAPAGPLTVKIFEAKRLTYNAWVRVKGHVTAPPGILGTRMMYIQDDTSGILIYLPKGFDRILNLGDRVEVVGNLRAFHDEFEIVTSQRSNIKFLEPGSPLPPLPIATTSLLEPYEGMLVILDGRAVDFKGRTTLWLDDGTGWAKTYIRNTTGIKKPFINRGDPMAMVGIVSQYSDEDDPSRNDYRLLPRYQTDLIIASATAVPAHFPSQLPETGNR